MSACSMLFLSSSTPSPSSSSSHPVTLGVFRAPTATYQWPPLTLNGLGSAGTPRFVSRPTSPSILSQDTKTGSLQSTSVGRHGEITINSYSPPGENNIPTTSSTPSSDGDKSGDLWTRHARLLRIPNATSAEWVCVWTVPGLLHPCYYQGKKQLVKRHVETKHMLIKRFICEFCNKKFAQKTSLGVHVSSRHLKDEPHRCEYRYCEARYNDPAGLCRHNIEAHGYVPRSTSRKTDKSPHPAAAELQPRDRIACPLSPSL
ncbi:hypothetical protein L218DRAFT_1003711 [Marasmius fiardii PR-910]|nr:hypothetical protein L218DRAFT_1003711 [Marasmius fiardii PR-910]